MRADLKYYLSMRLRSFDFLMLAVLFALILFELDDPIITWMKGVCFLFCGFVLFRLLDDLGVKEIDLIDHPERTYLIGKSYKLLVKAFSCLVAVDVLLAFIFYGTKTTLIFTAYLFVSIAVYYIFRKDRRILEILPFSKYPFLYLLLACQIPVPSSFLSALGVLTMILVYESLEKDQKLNSILLVLASGFLFYFNFPLLIGLFCTLLFCVFILLKPRYSVVKYFPLIYFPVTVFLMKYLIRINLF